MKEGSEAALLLAESVWRSNLVCEGLHPASRMWSFRIGLSFFWRAVHTSRSINRSIRPFRRGWKANGAPVASTNRSEMLVARTL